MDPVQDWAEFGERVREARLAVGKSQTDLARDIDIERTALVRVEMGQRQVSALELMRLAEALGLPVAHFVTRPPVAVTSRRQPLGDIADAASRERYLLDADLEAHARDAGWLVERQLLVPPQQLQRHSAADAGQAAELARAIRRFIGRPSGPLGAMADAAEQLGLYLTVVDRDAEGASLLLDGFGVAVVGGRADPGRRRFTAAHELGHHLLEDAYHTDVGVAASHDEREKIIDTFVAEFLLPAADLHDAWRTTSETDPRNILLRLAGTYRISWSAAVAVAQRQNLIDGETTRRLRTDVPVRGDFLAALGHEPEPDLALGETGPAWRRAALTAWQRGLITASRTVELLHGAVTLDELPTQSVDPASP